MGDIPTDTLTDRIAREIDARGPITFARFMELALYDEQDGFFAGEALGPDAHFVTSPHVSAAFGILIARQLGRMWQAMGEPGRFDVVEVGAGDGTLATQINSSRGAGKFAEAMRYVAVERTAAGRARLEAQGIATRPTLPDEIEGCVLANELLDNMPFHRFRTNAEGQIVEVMVARDGDRFVEVEAEPTIEHHGKQTVSPQAIAHARDLATHLTNGYALLIDYGFTNEEEPEPIRGYRAQRLTTDLLTDPGSCDITGPVDFDAFAAAARDAGLQAFGPVTQREALMALGYRDLIDELRSQQQALEVKGEWPAAIRAYNARGEATMLVDEAGLGSLKVLVLATEGLPEPDCTKQP